MPGRQRLLIFCRHPVPGRVKTRLVPALGPEGAAGLYRRMARRTVMQARTLGVPCTIWVADGGAEPAIDWLGPGPDYRRQPPGDLGRRMAHAMAEAFETGATAAVLIGTDCPGLDAAAMQSAFERLRERDLVLGPARDGGYYLLGLRRPAPGLFEGVPWGTSQVLERTLELADRLRLAHALLPELEDVDRPEDLGVWERAISGTISAVIPAYNESLTIGATLDTLSGCADIVVADGGSADRTADLARMRGAHVVASPRGRAVQMNAGARDAWGDILLFLHADTLLPEGFADHVRGLLAQSGVIAGAFRLGIEGRRPALRLIERLANWRTRAGQMPYGDQGLFIRSRAFREIGPFAEMPLLEDVEFVRRLARHGRIALAPVAVRTSGRRWHEQGILRTTLVNQAILAGYFCGVSPRRLANWYRRGRASPTPPPGGC